MTTKIGSFCSIHSTVILGKNVKVHDHAVIEENCTIGDNTIIAAGVTFRPNTKIGKDCKIGIGAQSEGNNQVGDRVTCHANSHMCQGLTVEDDVFFGPYSITLNVKNIVHGRNFEMRVEGPTIKRAARVAGSVILMPGVTVGENAVIGTGSLVTKDVPPRELWMGSPAYKHRDVPEEEIL